ncbi:MAG: hypothetical protein KKG33_06005 [candidate division Zixibacteria bacterium]|nr:hypothetical protein [candidate division Zixibacteria bacterium]
MQKVELVSGRPAGIVISAGVSALLPYLSGLHFRPRHYNSSHCEEQDADAEQDAEWLHHLRE